MIAGIGAVLPQFLALVVLLAAAYVPLGNWIARGAHQVGPEGLHGSAQDKDEGNQ